MTNRRCGCWPNTTGWHTGDVVVTADDLIGHVVNVAARVTALAKGGQVLVTADTLAGAGELAGVRILRSRRRALRGVSERVAVSRVEWVASPAGIGVSAV